jgi:hypothetical protein
MLSIKWCPVEAVKQGIAKSYEGDYKGLQNFYDPVTVKEVKSIDDAVEDTFLKIMQYKESGVQLCNHLVFCDNKVAGHFSCFWDDQHGGCRVVSFGINKDQRSPVLLKELFEKITAITGQYFYTVLWDKNTRAITWLKKCGMKEKEKLKERKYSLTILTSE